MFGDAIDELAEETSTLDISDCSNPKPLVFRVRQNASFTARNTSSVEHTLGINEFRATVPPGSDTTVTFDDRIGGSGLGNYGYACDDQAPVGVIQVIP